MHYFANTPQKRENIYKFKYAKSQITVFSLFGGSIAMRQWLLLWLLLLGERLLQTHAFPGVVLPVQQLLFVDEFGTLGINQLFPEVLVLQQLQHVQTVRVPVQKKETPSQPHHIQTGYPLESAIQRLSVMVCADEETCLPATYLRYLAYSGSFQYNRYLRQLMKVFSRKTPLWAKTA